MDGNNGTGRGWTAKMMKEEHEVLVSSTTTPTQNNAMKNSEGQGCQSATAEVNSDSGILEVEQLLEEPHAIGWTRVMLKPNPLLIFPEEVWERVLLNLMDSHDIVNVFRVFPILDGLVMKNKYEWLIDQAMPHIFPCLDVRDVLTCRQVSRRWTRGVDNFLENHPQKRAYDHENQVTGQLWTPDASKAHYCLEYRFAGLRRFTREKMFTDFMNDMCTQGIRLSEGQ